MIALVLPWTHQTWFAPFVGRLSSSLTLDPWLAFISQGGDRLSFPYGPVMCLVFAIPAAIFGAFSPLSDQIGLTSSLIGTTILALEVLTLFFLVRISGSEKGSIAWFFWLSPLALYISYWHGQLDMVPVFFMIATFFLIKRGRGLWAGVALGLGVAAKLSVALAVPFFLIYLYRNTRQRAFFAPFVLGVVLVAGLGAGLVTLLPGYRAMVMGSSEIQKVFYFALPLGRDVNVFVMPILYSLLLYSAWRIERMSFELFFVFVGMAFFTVLLFTPASTGWFLWILPFMAFIQSRAGGATALVGAAFSLLFVLANVLFATGAFVRPFGIDLTLAPLGALSVEQRHFLHSLLVTGMWVTGALFCLQMFIHGIRRNDFFRLSRRPLAVGISGDSGVGKDTFTSAIAGLFGDDSVTVMFGDDYHRWDRSAPMWKMITHLDPRGNDLSRFAGDVLSLLDGRAVSSRHYDHSTGRFKRASSKEKRDVVVVSGLHSLFVQPIRERLDLAIHMDMHEGLRRFLKVKRDVNQRGRDINYVLESLDKRAPDADSFVRPQAEKADIVFKLGVADGDNLERSVARQQYKLDVSIRDSVNSERLMNALVGVCGMNVDCKPVDKDGVLRISIEGDLQEDDVKLIAKRFIPDMDDLLGWCPRWEGGMLGVMQLVFLSQAHSALQRRIAYA
jgi:uridine kinase